MKKDEPISLQGAEALRQALIDGEESGPARYSFEGIMAELDALKGAIREGLESGDPMEWDPEEMKRSGRKLRDSHKGLTGC